jgi:hypothetical protein
MYIGLRGNCPLFLPDFNETWIFFTNFRTILNYQFSWKAVRQSRVVPCARTDAETDRHEEANSRFSKFCERAQKRIIELIRKQRCGCHTKYNDDSRKIVLLLRYLSVMSCCRSSLHPVQYEACGKRKTAGNFERPILCFHFLTFYFFLGW